MKRYLLFVFHKLEYGVYYGSYDSIDEATCAFNKDYYKGANIIDTAVKPFDGNYIRRWEEP